MEKEYDKLIEQHYRKVAEEHGLSASSSMEDVITRKLETEAIIRIAGDFLLKIKREGRQATVLDVGCGNGYTIDVLLKNYPGQKFVGIEKYDELRKLASSRFAGHANVNIFTGDVRDPDFAKGVVADIAICQRVLINLLDHEDQKLALNNIISSVVPPRDTRRTGGALLFIECFSSTLAKLNEARGELDLPPIPPAYHNLYLPDEFFETPRLRIPEASNDLPPPNLLSTHYYVSRVLYPFFIKGRPFKRNSEFVHFLSAALKENIGDYSPLKLYIFERAGNA